VCCTCLLSIIMTDATMPDGRQIRLLIKGPGGIRLAVREDESEFWVRIIEPSVSLVLPPPPAAAADLMQLEYSSPIPANPGPATQMDVEIKQCIPASPGPATQMYRGIEPYRPVTQMYRGIEPYRPVTHMSRIREEIKKYIPSLTNPERDCPQFGDMVYAYDRATNFTARVISESYTFTLDIDKIFVPARLICTSGKQQLYLNAMDPATNRAHKVEFSFEQDHHSNLPSELLIYERSGLGTAYKIQRFLADVRSIIYTLFQHAPESSRLAISKGLYPPNDDDEPPAKQAKLENPLP